MESLEEEALFRSYPYLVQSPTTTPSFHSPTTQRHLTLLSHYSSSRGSTNSLILHDTNKKIDNVPNYESPQYEGEMVVVKMGEKRFDEEEDEEVDEKGFGKKKMWDLVTFSECDPCIWIWFQISLRVMVSFGVALLFFYLITKPPPPVLSLQIEKMKAFELGEGVDNTGVTTKFLTCNSSLHLVVNIKSKLYALHIHPVVLTLSFNNIPFATSTEPHELYASSNGPTSFMLYVGTTNKPMYGAGRSMQDILDSRKGLSLVIHVQMRSRFLVVGKLIRLKYRHRAECVLVLNRTYDKHNKTLMYDNQCTLL